MMSAAKGYAVILQPTVPTELLEVLKDYLIVNGPLPYVLSYVFEEAGYFATLSLLKKGKKKPWNVRLPISYILVIVEISKDENPLGFVAPK